MSQKNKIEIIRILAKAILCVLVLWGISSCGFSRPEPPPSIVENTVPSPKEILDSVGQKATGQKLKPMVTFEPLVASQTEFPYEGKLFSLSVRDMPLEDVLLALAQEARLNLVIDRKVKRGELVSVEFANIPLQTALENLMDVYDYFYTIKQGVLNIQAFEERIFHVNYPLVFSTPDSSTGGDVLGSGGGGSSETIQTTDSGIKGEFTTSTSVEDEGSLDIWKQIEEALEPAKGGESGLVSSEGLIRINRMGATIIVKDYPSNVESIAKFLQSIQASLRRQVIIEAKIVEVILDKSHQFGINWEHMRLPFNTQGTSLESSVNLGDLATTGLSMTFKDIFGADTGEAVLNALATNGTVNILSSPRISVINNQTAFINVGRVVPFLDYVVGESTNTGDNNDFTTIDSVPVISRFNEGVTLGITPQIDEEGTTILHIVPIVTEQTGTEAIDVPSTTPGVEGTTANIPVISVRTTDTIVRVEDRTTIVIGGLISELTSDAVSKVPFLGDIPGINWLFAHQERETQKRELVILLTPTVIMR